MHACTYITTYPQAALFEEEEDREDQLSLERARKAATAAAAATASKQANGMSDAFRSTLTMSPGEECLDGWREMDGWMHRCIDASGEGSKDGWCIGIILNACMYVGVCM